MGNGFVMVRRDLLEQVARPKMASLNSLECGLVAAAIAKQEICKVLDEAGAPSPIRLSSDRERRIYVAGPMTGLPDLNFPAFNAMAAKLRAEGWHVENPAEHGVVNGAEWADYLRFDIGLLASCEAIMLLPGWSKSKGANLEVHIARQLGMPIKLAEGAESAG